MSIYASNDKNNWKKIGTYEEDKKYGPASWCFPAYDNYYKTIESIQAAEPVFVEVVFPAAGKSYKYLKVVVDELFDYQGFNPSYGNLNQYLFLQELEIYTSKD